MRFIPKIKKTFISILLGVFAFTTFASALLYAPPANAQMGVAVLSDLQASAQKVWDTIKEGWKIAVINMAQQTVSYFFRKVAYDSAVWVASGGKGQSPFAETDSPGDYLKKTALDAGAHGIEQLGKPFGLNLCKIPDVKVDLAVRMGLHYNFMGSTAENAPKPDCKYSELAANWSSESWKSKYGDKDGGFDTGKVFNTSFKAENTDFGYYFKAKETVDRMVLQQEEDARLKRAEGQGFKAATNLIDGKIKTPAQVIAQEAKATAPSKKQEKGELAVMASIQGGVYQAIPNALSLFLNTLTGQMMKNFQEKGMLPFGVGCVGSNCPKATSVTQYDSSGFVTGRAAAESVFSEYLVSKIERADNYDILSQLNSCDMRGVYNCRADAGIIQAVQETELGEPMTIWEAMKRGWLREDWKLYSDKRIEKNSDQNCYNDGYCYSNIKVLRQLRIVPLGFEIAAKNSDADHPWTLGQVVKGFYDCNYIKDASGNIVGVNYDPVNKPFCHLIDPNWVLKIDKTRCNAMGYGAMPLSSDTPERIKECVDLSTCVAYNKDGQCINYGYCAREKNVWRFDADKCDSQYATCRAYSDENGKTVAYLYRTLNTGDCNQNSTGCKAYSLDKELVTETGADGKTAQVFKWLSVGEGGTAKWAKNKIFLNKNVSTACGANSDGCSAFKLAAAEDQIVALRKAPDYLGCYDVNPGTSQIDWPQTVSDLTKLKTREECNSYSPACIPQEVGCAYYTPADDASAPSIPGKFTPAQKDGNTISAWNDQCDKQCVGYNAYREMPTEYSNGQSLTYLTPPSKYNDNTSGAKCSAEEVGCSSFTNMGETQDGGEKIEYFTYLRACIKPDATKQKNYYTYEGSAKGGYQLKTFTLEEDKTGDSDAVFKKGGPKYTFKTIDNLNTAKTLLCNEELYKNNSADLDCRQFNDDKGNVYYRLLAHVIPVSENCTEYRLNSSELYNDTQKICFGDGEYNQKDNSCYYFGLPAGAQTTAGASKSCSAEVVSCREYKGNNGNNVKNVFELQTFESADSVGVNSGWGVAQGSEGSAGVITWSPESTRVGEHSLGFSGKGILYKKFDIPQDSIDSAGNVGLSISFWAKGNGKVDVKVRDGDNKEKTAGVITAGDTWQFYKFNVEVASSGDSRLIFNSSAVNLYIDNARVAKVADLLYLVKNSLKVDALCDDNQEDNLPGIALGCTAYNGPQNNLNNSEYYLTNFSFLCRENAIGCTALLDTQNTLDTTQPSAYNVWLSGQSGMKTEANINGAIVSCNVPKGRDGCYVNIKGKTKEEIQAGVVASNGQLQAAPQFKNSTVYFPADTPSGNPLYLVANNSTACQQTEIGCMAAGVQTETPSGPKLETVMIKNNPAQYETSVDSDGNQQPAILCDSDAVGCVEYPSSAGNFYFKDPVATGAKICSYKENVQYKGTTASGWFRKGVGTCAVNTQKFCASDSDCGKSADGTTDIKCENLGAIPCYSTYVKSGNDFGLWSYGDKEKYYGDKEKYQGYVGECPAVQNGCSEFVDKNDNNKAYYFIKNDKISEGTCGGMASQKAGCALFDETGNPNKYWNTAATYALSDNYIPGKDADFSQATKVQPKSAKDTEDKNDKNDANIIIQVKRDRVCGEWYQGMGSHPEWDQSLVKWKKVYYSFGLCNKAIESGNVQDDDTGCANPILSVDQILTQENYVVRGTSWKDLDMSGYSMLGMYPMDRFGQYNYGDDKNPDWRLAKAIACGGNNCGDGQTNTSKFCKDDGGKCGKNLSGICKNSYCLQTTTGVPDNNEEIAPKHSCRAYPEKDSPFKNNEQIKSLSSFDSVNLCETDNECDCDYTKITYGDAAMKKYWSYEPKVELKEGICFGGDKNGKQCSADVDCNADEKNIVSLCYKQKKKAQVVGWKGFCLEHDESRSINGDKSQRQCLTWYPVDNLMGALDINNQHKDAGYQPSENASYCMKANVFMRPRTYYGCVTNSHSSCNLHKDEDGCDWSKAQCAEGYVMYKGGCSSRENTTPDTRGKCEDYDPSILTYTDGCLYFCVPIDAVDKESGQKCYDQHYKPNSKGYNDDQDRFLENKCFADYLIPYDEGKYFGSFTGRGSYTLTYYEMYLATGKYQLKEQGDIYGIGCEVVARIKDNKNSIAKTDKIWRESTQIDLSPSDISILYKKNAKFSPFGSLERKTDDTTKEPVAISWCSKNIFDITNTLSSQSGDNTCKLEYNLGNISFGSSKYDQNINQGFAYNYFKINSKKSCANTKDCGEGGECDVHGFCCYGKDCGKLLKQSFEVEKIESVDLPAKRLSSIFVKFTDVFDYDITKINTNVFGKYNSLDSKNVVGCKGGLCDLTETEGSALTAPKVHPVGSCDSGEVCEEIQQDGITINGKWNEDIKIFSGAGKVVMKFFASADDDHMPIKSITVNWGTGEMQDVVNLVGQFRNRIGKKMLPAGTLCLAPEGKSKWEIKDWANGGVCNFKPNFNISCNLGDPTGNECSNKKSEFCVSSEDKALGFGQILGKTCDNSYFSFENMYFCYKGGPGYQPTCDKYSSEFPDGCCVFRPSVKIIDNWGWCNGKCVGEPGGDGCYEEECKSQVGGSKTNFSGQIFVAPSQ